MPDKMAHPLALFLSFLSPWFVHASKQPFWGCGLLGDLGSGIKADGSTSADMKKVIDVLKSTNKHHGKVTYWNWNYAPMDNDPGPNGTKAGHQYLTEDFVFMPQNWGVTPIANESFLRPALATNWTDSQGIRCPAMMSDVLLGANEPDIIGSCMGDMMGACIGPCTPAAVSRGDCPVAHVNGTSGTAKPNHNGHCDCWSSSHPTGVGFWPVPSVSNYQPLPKCWSNKECASSILDSWKNTSATAVGKGYKYTVAPLVAANTDWMKQFVRAACKSCSDISCGCPSHVGWHFYADDCQPEKGGGYASFQQKLNATVELMEEFPHLQGAIINEVGMLNCRMDTPDAICIPNDPSQKYPARSQPNHSCPSTPTLPKGLGSFIEALLKMVSKAKTSDGREAVVSFTWFNLDMVGGTYNLRIFNDDGTLNEVGESYLGACKAWADGVRTPEVVV